MSSAGGNNSGQAETETARQLRRDQAEAATRERQSRIERCQEEQTRLQNDTKYTQITNPQERAQAIRKDRARMERDFYWSRHGSDGKGKPLTEQERQATLERSEVQWNAMKAEEARLKGEDTWTYKHDRRDATVHSEGTKIGIDGKEYRYHETNTELYSRETTIDWREDTVYGNSRAQQVQGQVSNRTGNVAAHQAPSWTGADPEGVNAGGARPPRHERVHASERSNYSNWDPSVNASGDLRQNEATIDRMTRHPSTPGQKDGTEPVGHVKVHEVFRSEEERSKSMAAGREFTITDSEGRTVQPPTAQAPSTRVNWNTVDAGRGMNPASPSAGPTQAGEAEHNRHGQSREQHRAAKSRTTSKGGGASRQGASGDAKEPEEKPTRGASTASKSTPAEKPKQPTPPPKAKAR